MKDIARYSFGAMGRVRWIEAEFGMSNVSATRFINVADRFGDKSFTVKDFQSAVSFQDGKLLASALHKERLPA